MYLAIYCFIEQDKVWRWNGVTGANERGGGEWERAQKVWPIHGEMRTEGCPEGSVGGLRLFLVGLTEAQDSWLPTVYGPAPAWHQTHTFVAREGVFSSCNWWEHPFLSGRNYSSQFGGLYSSKHCLSPGQAWLQGAPFPHAFQKHIHFSRKIMMPENTACIAAECSSSQKADWKGGWMRMVPALGCYLLYIEMSSTGQVCNSLTQAAF